MNPKEYEQNVLITESCDFTPIKNRIDDRMIRLLHAGLGLSSELAELEAAMNKPELDLINISEEAGDLYWYCAVAVNTLGFDHDGISVFELDRPSNETLKETISTSVWAVGEFNDLLKKHLFYGRELNMEKMSKTLRQLCMAVSGICVACGKTPAQVRETNINKLRARFGEKFTEAAALNRNLEVERKILEGETV
jgi:hypothetical protein